MISRNFVVVFFPLRAYKAPKNGKYFHGGGGVAPGRAVSKVVPRGPVVGPVWVLLRQDRRYPSPGQGGMPLAVTQDFPL